MTADNSSQIADLPKCRSDIGDQLTPAATLLCPSDEVLRETLRDFDQATHSTELLGHLSTCQFCQDRITEWGQQGSFESLMHRARDNEVEVRSIPDNDRLDHRSAVKPGQPDRVTNNYDEPAIRRINNYDLLELIGSGGSANVYKGRHIHLDRYVAIKLLLDQYSESKVARLRFFREMKSIGQLDHPSIVHAYDAGESEGVLYLVMELVVGENVDSFSRRIGPMPIPDACEIIRQAALGLQHIHENGLVHRDLKPSNLLISRHGIKIADLGLALLLDDENTDRRLTGHRTVLGTADYMAPEQAEGSHEVDIRADLYSLGCTLFRLLAGQPPFSGPGHDTPIKKMLAHAAQPFPDLLAWRPDIPADLNMIVQKLTAKDRSQRYDTPLEFAQALDPFCGDIDLRKLGITVPVQMVRTYRSTIPISNIESLDSASATKVLGESRSMNRRSPSRFGWLALAALSAVILTMLIFPRDRSPDRDKLSKSENSLSVTPVPEDDPSKEEGKKPPTPPERPFALPPRSMLEQDWARIFGVFPEDLPFPGRPNNGAVCIFADPVGKLNVYSEKAVRLIQLGVLGENDDAVISFTLPRLPQSGTFGFFAGFDAKKAYGQERSWFHQVVLQLVPGIPKDKTSIQWGHASADPREGAWTTVSLDGAEVNIDNFEQPLTLEFRLKPNDLSSISINRVPVVLTNKNDYKPLYIGSYGIVVRDGEFSFKSPQITRIKQ